jgi:hypothetical protein
MNSLADPFKQLVERKLWPVALLLVAALVAVPVLLTKKADTSAPLPTATATVPAGQGDTDPVVALADANRTDQLRAVLGDRKDPFRPAQVHHVPKVDDGLTQDAGAPTTVDSGSGSTGGGTTPTTTGGTTVGGGDVVSTPDVTATPEPGSQQTFELYSLEVRFGSTDGELVSRNVKRLTGLPGGTNPAVLYLGLLDDHRSAVFMVDADVNVLGDGVCDPSPDNCQTLTLKKGETEFLTRGDKQWELDLVSVHVKRTDDAQQARKARGDEARHGRRAARHMGVGRAGYRYDPSSGALRRIKAKPGSAGLGALGAR